ncbi:auxin-responsive protein SAUR36-like [Quillaja saponaria]|uniref:Auxin-responsive protein SAUR36-like n=1 Tax=Quillaja saponaria TaxID=32244 RepID=A0AAD7LQC4_QUISA|nr:auxin-responsive protein SAUR36-like [Quillaja saponaria]
MRKIRGFKLGKRLIRFSKWVLRKTRIRPEYQRLNSPQSHCKGKNSISKILTWGRRLTNGARSLCAAKPGSGYVPLGRSDLAQEKAESAVPKGQWAVYVGQKDGDFHRVLVPVIYFNHPLFGELLREAEEQYGFQHQGGITIPCKFTEFEKGKTRIASGSGGRGRRLKWKRQY